MEAEAGAAEAALKSTASASLLNSQTHFFWRTFHGQMERGVIDPMVQWWKKFHMLISMQCWPAWHSALSQVTLCFSEWWMNNVHWTRKRRSMIHFYPLIHISTVLQSSALRWRWRRSKRGGSTFQGYPQFLPHSCLRVSFSIVHIAVVNVVVVVVDVVVIEVRLLL